MLSNYTHLKDTIKIMIVVAGIVSFLFLIFYLSTYNEWDATPCEEILEFDITLIYDEHLEFLDRYNYCLTQS